MRLRLIMMVTSSFSFTSAVHFAELLRFTSSSSKLPAATPGSQPCSHAPQPTYARDLKAMEKLEMRQAPAVAPIAPVPIPPADPVIPPENPPAPPIAPVPVPPANINPAVVPPAVAPIAPAINPIPPALAPANPVVPPPTTLADGTKPTVSISVTVKWVETWIADSRTWVPRTITQTFNLQGDVGAPAPGIGVIGMGTLTGRTGVTRTLVQGAAETRAVGMGLVGVGVVAGLVGLV